jgi:epoxyqueuosine reductase
VSDERRGAAEHVLPPHYVAELLAAARTAGLDAVGVCRAEPFVEARQALETRKRDGLDGGMQFTYRNPARATDPSSTVPGARALIVGALSYRRRWPEDGVGGDRGRDDPEPSMRIGAFAWRGYYDLIRAAFAPVIDRLRHDGHRAVVSVDENSLVDRAAAVRAGLGWYGKNANVLLPGAGSWYVLGSVITDAPLVAADPAPVAEGCGACRRCIDSCPTGAILAPGVVDARRCLAWHVQAPGVFPHAYRRALGDRFYGCDDCQEVCPPNRRSESRWPAAEADVVARAPALAVLTATDDELAAQFDRWYIHDRDVDLLRRNALVVLGNALAGDAAQRTPRARAVLSNYLRHPRALLRAHAVWAAAQGDCHDLLESVRDDADPLVRSELQLASPS